MNKNMGSIDRAARIAVAILFALLFFTGTVTGTLGIILVVIAGIFILTGLIGFCPLYYPFGFNTFGKKHADSAQL